MASSATWCSPSSCSRAERAFLGDHHRRCGPEEPAYLGGARVQDYLHSGPLGFPVVDVAVCLTDGSHHSVDSSDMAFRGQAGRLAMSEGLPQCQPVLLEPIMAVEIAVPSGGDAADQLDRLVPSRADSGLRRTLRMARLGRGSGSYSGGRDPEPNRGNCVFGDHGCRHFSAKLDHLAELVGKAADQVLSHRSDRAA